MNVAAAPLRSSSPIVSLDPSLLNLTPFTLVLRCMLEVAVVGAPSGQKPHSPASGSARAVAELVCLHASNPELRPRVLSSVFIGPTVLISVCSSGQQHTHVLLRIDAREQLKPDRGETPRPPLLSCIASARPRRPRRVQDPAGEPWVSLLLFSSSRTRQSLSILSTRKNLAGAIRSRSGGGESPGPVHGGMAAGPVQAGSNRLLPPSLRPPMGQPVPNLAQPGFRPRSFPFSFSCILLHVGLQ
jgi:hypothetical protein